MCFRKIYGDWLGMLGAASLVLLAATAPLSLAPLAAANRRGRAEEHARVSA